LLEARFHASACFVTFTYANEHLPADYSLSKREAQLLLKRIRARFPDDALRYFLIGEHGDSEGGTRRPHYHAILYGLNIDDAAEIEPSGGGHRQWESPALSACWGKGRVTVGEFSGGAASYTAGYVHKKLGRRADDAAYLLAHPLTGEVFRVRREFALMSRRPGIGLQWYREFSDTDALADTIRRDGRIVAMPGYFRDLRDAERKAVLDAKAAAAGAFGTSRLFTEFEFEKLLRQRAADLTPERLAVREEAHRLRTASLSRGGAL
jgi:hypothetical protein